VTDTKTVHQVLLDVRAAIGVVRKDRQATEGARYNFRGIDAVVNAFAPVSIEHGLNVYPSKVSHVEIGTTTYGKNNVLAQTAGVTIEYTVVGPAGDSFTIEAAGHSFDSGDKALGKANSYAWRTALVQLLNLPTDEPEPDAIIYSDETAEIDWRMRVGAKMTRDDAAARFVAAGHTEADMNDWRHPFWEQIARVIGA